jgi:hypothetical protein
VNVPPSEIFRTVDLVSTFEKTLKYPLNTLFGVSSLTFRHSSATTKLQADGKRPVRFSGRLDGRPHIDEKILTEGSRSQNGGIVPEKLNVPHRRTKRLEKLVGSVIPSSEVEIVIRSFQNAIVSISRASEAKSLCFQLMIDIE